MPLEQMYFVLALMLLIRAGQAMLLCGMVRSKNAASVAVRLLLDLAVITLGLWAIGAVWMPSLEDVRLMTFGHFFGIAPTSTLAFNAMPPLVIASATLYAAAAERSRLSPLIVLSALLAVLIIPLLLQVELRFNTRWSVLDSGIGIGSIAGGTMGLAAAYFTGARKNKFNRDQSVNFLPGHHVVFQVIGLLLMIAGWTSAAHGSINVILGASAAVIGGATYGRVRFGKIDTGLMLLATIGGLCAAGVGAAMMPTWAAVLLGLIAGVTVPGAVIFVETQLRIDDVAGLSVAYLVGGSIGWIGAALLFTDPEGLRSHFTTLIAHLVMLFATSLFAGVCAVLVLTLFKKAGHLRVSETAEFDGMDLSELDVNAYPDFQQNMIKSHHLREL